MHACIATPYINLLIVTAPLHAPVYGKRPIHLPRRRRGTISLPGQPPAVGIAMPMATALLQASLAFGLLPDGFDLPLVPAQALPLPRLQTRCARGAAGDRLRHTVLIQHAHDLQTAGVLLAHISTAIAIAAAWLTAPLLRQTAALRAPARAATTIATGRTRLHRARPHAHTTTGREQGRRCRGG